jgi:hypothetical protein
MARHSAVDKSILEAALIGLEQQKAEIDAKAAEIRKRLRGLPAGSKSEAEPAARAKRVLSPAARKRIAAATRKRWAEYRAAKAAAQGPGKKAAKKKVARKKAPAAAEAPASA